MWMLVTYVHLAVDYTELSLSVLAWKRETEIVLCVWFIDDPDERGIHVIKFKNVCTPKQT